MPEQELENLKNRIVKIALDRLGTIINMKDTDGGQRLSNNVDQYYDLFEAGFEDYKCLVGLLERLSKSPTSSPKELTLIQVLMYLVSVEGHICNSLTFISYLLAISGHDLYSLTKRKYVKDNIEEIRKVEMSTKIQFLNHHGFGLLTKEYDSTLRNDIAHHNYKIDEDGILWVRGKPVNLESKVRSLTKILGFIRESFTEIAEKTRKLIEEFPEPQPPGRSRLDEVPRK